MKILVTAAIVLSAAVLTRAEAEAPAGQQPTEVSAKQEEKPKITPEKKAELKKLMEIRRGGPKVPRPGTLKGKIGIVNAQSAADKSILAEGVEYLRRETNFTIEFSDGEFNFGEPRIVGGATLFVIDDEKMPRVLVAPENRWAVMNVAALKTDKTAFFAARVKKELSRSFAMLCGGMTSNYGISLVGPVTKSEDLDVFPDGKLPIDVIVRMEPYMSGFGVTPAKMVPYRVACKEGWAHEPTNEVEKAVWDEFHELPTKPVKIQFDPKRGK